jgi:predicted small metal-binding protein
MTIPGMHRVQVAVDCECGMTVEACDDEELLDELLEHIAAAHEAVMRRDAVDLLIDAYEAQTEGERAPRAAMSA